MTTNTEHISRPYAFTSVASSDSQSHKPQDGSIDAPRFDNAIDKQRPSTSLASTFGQASALDKADPYRGDYVSSAADTGDNASKYATSEMELNRRTESPVSTTNLDSEPDYGNQIDYIEKTNEWIRSTSRDIRNTIFAEPIGSGPAALKAQKGERRSSITLDMLEKSDDASEKPAAIAERRRYSLATNLYGSPIEPDVLTHQRRPFYLPRTADDAGDMEPIGRYAADDRTTELDYYRKPFAASTNANLRANDDDDLRADAVSFSAAAYHDISAPGDRAKESIAQQQPTDAMAPLSTNDRSSTEYTEQHYAPTQLYESGGPVAEHGSIENLMQNMQLSTGNADGTSSEQLASGATQFTTDPGDRLHR